MDGDAPGESRDAFSIVRPAWQELDAQADYFFQRVEWLEVLAAHLDADLAWSSRGGDDRATAVSVLARSVRRAGPIRLRLLTRVRLGEGGLVLADGIVDRRAASVPQLRDLLDDFGPWHVTWLVAVRERSPWLRFADQALVRPELDRGVGILDTSSTFEDAWNRVSKNMRDSVRKSRRKIDEAGGARISVHDGPGLGNAFAQFAELESSGWKGRSQSGFMSLRNEYVVWHDYLERTSSAQIRFMHVAGQLAAAQLVVTTARTAFLFKIAYNEELSQLSPSNVLMADLIEACANDPDIDRIDCMVWQPWHPRWGMEREPTYSLVAFNRRTVRGLAAQLARRVWEIVDRARLRRQHPEADPQP